MKQALKYKGLSKDELYLISRAEYEKQKLLTGDYAKNVFNDSKKAANTLDKLKRKGRLVQIERGKYFIVPIKSPNQLWSPNEFITAKYWMGDTPYCLGYFSMYNYWGFTEQVPQTVFILNTGKSRSKTIGGIRYKAVKISKDKYYGVTKVRIEDEDICISDKERTLVDFIYKPVGSLENIRQALKNNINKIDLNKFITTVPVIFLVIQAVPTIGYFHQHSDPPQTLVKWGFSRKEPRLKSVELCRATALN